jgi:hypothetical protein
MQRGPGQPEVKTKRTQANKKGRQADAGGIEYWLIK